MPLHGPHELLLLGISHRSAPVELRERCAVPQDAHVRHLRQLEEACGFKECWLLSTCNRTEVLVLSADAFAAERRIRDAVFAGARLEEGDPLYVHRGVDAVFHVFSVAAGLKSQVLGESQILAQIRQALEVAREAGTVGPVLEALLQQALALGKRVRRETQLGQGTLSVARAGVDLAHKVLGRFDRAAALIVGAGDTGVLAARHLRDGGIGSLRFCNRTPSRAEAAARELAGSVVPFGELRAELARSDLVVFSVAAPEPILVPAWLRGLHLKSRALPPVIIDLSVPRAVHPDLRGHPDLLVHDLDDLTAVVEAHHQERHAEVEAAARLVVADVHKFLSLRTYAAFKPLITGLRETFEEIRRELVCEQGREDPELERLSRRLTRRLLDAALTQMKHGSRLTQSEQVLGRHYQRYLERS